MWYLCHILWSSKYAYIYREREEEEEEEEEENIFLSPLYPSKTLDEEQGVENSTRVPLQCSSQTVTSFPQLL